MDSNKNNKVCQKAIDKLNNIELTKKCLEQEICPACGEKLKRETKKRSCLWDNQMTEEMVFGLCKNCNKEYVLDSYLIMKDNWSI
jgi:predicted amidophosphoribosyltransferase